MRRVSTADLAVSTATGRERVATNIDLRKHRYLPVAVLTRLSDSPYESLEVAHGSDIVRKNRAVNQVTGYSVPVGGLLPIRFFDCKNG